MMVPSYGRRMKMAKFGNRCVALVGIIGSTARCSIYDNRPTCCRNYDASQRVPECNDCRLAHGLTPLPIIEPHA